MGFRIGRGTKVSLGSIVGANTSYTYVELKGVQDLELPSVEVDEVEVSSFSSPNRSREFIAGLEDAGEVTLTVLWDEGSATDTAINSAATSRANVRLKFNVGNSHVETWNTFVKSSKFGLTDDEAITKDVVFRVSSRAEAE